jgi:hypothetical protein
MSKWIGPLVGLGILAAVVVFWNPTICSQVENLVGKAVPFCGANYHSSSNPIDFITHSLGGPGTAQHQQQAHNVARAVARHQTIPASIHSADKRHAFDKAHPGGPTVPAFNVDPLSIGASKANLVELTYESMSI